MASANTDAFGTASARTTEITCVLMRLDSESVQTRRVDRDGSRQVISALITDPFREAEVLLSSLHSTSRVAGPSS